MEEIKTYWKNSWTHWILAWIIFLTCFELPAIIVQSKLLGHAYSVLFLGYLAIFFQLKRYKNNYYAFKVGKDTYIPLFAVNTLLFCLFFSDLRAYSMERIYLYKVQTLKIEQSNYSKKDIMKMKESIENIDFVLKMLAVPSRLMGSMIDTFLTPFHPDKDSGSCYQLTYKKLKDSIEGQIHFQGEYISNKSQTLSESGYLEYLLTMNLKELNHKVDQGILDKIKEERELSNGLFFGKLNCQQLLLK